MDDKAGWIPHMQNEIKFGLYIYSAVVLQCNGLIEASLWLRGADIASLVCQTAHYGMHTLSPKNMIAQALYQKKKITKIAARQGHNLLIYKQRMNVLMVTV